HYGVVSRTGTAQREHVEARSGPAFIEIANRGGDCPASVIYLQRLPGYTERRPGRVIKLRVPTCQASRHDMVSIPHGEFYRNRDLLETKSVDELTDLADYLIDRTEVTRGAFEPYDSMEALTGDGAAKAGLVHADRADNQRLPIVGVNFFTARNYCRYMGKDLPTLEQWQQAFRGGLQLGEVPNPEPKRMTTWRAATRKR